MSEKTSPGMGITGWLECQTHDWKVVGSNPCGGGGRIFFSRVNFLCWVLFQYPFHPCVTVVAHKRSQSFCQKCRWQVTAKHPCTICLCFAWSDMVHGCVVYTERTDTAAVSCGTSHFSVFSKIYIYKTSHSCRITCECSESAQEWRTVLLYQSDQQQQNTNVDG